MSSPIFDTSSGASSNTSVASIATGAALSTSGINRVLLAFITCNQATGTAAPTVSTLTDTLGLVWTKIFGNTLSYTVGGGAVQTRMELWWAATAAQITNDNVTAALSGTALGASIDVVAVSGCNNIALPFDIHANNPSSASDVTGTSGTPSTLLSTTSIDTLVLGMYYGGRNSITNGTGFTNIINRFVNPAVNKEYFTALGYEAFSSVQTALPVNGSAATTFWGMLGVALTGDAPPPPVTRSQALVVC